MPVRLERPRLDPHAQHGVVYRNDREFCGWPFLGGLWRTGDGAIVVAFTRHKTSYDNADAINHNNFSMPKGEVITLRSTDDGKTWDPSAARVLFDRTQQVSDILANGPQDYSQEGPVDFTDPNVLVASNAAPTAFMPESRATVRVSTDGGLSWRRPIILPMAGLGSLSGNASATVRADGMSLIAMIYVTPDSWTRRPVLFGSYDGITWNFICFITPAQDDGQAVTDRTGEVRFSPHRHFYPRPISLRSGRLLCSMRAQRDPTGILWTEMFESDDGGRTWRFLSRVNDWGAPGDIIELTDGRILCVYGYRLPAYGVRYRTSDDGGRTWGRETILRDDGGSWDLGYPRVVEIEPGKCLAVYYMNRKDDAIQLNGGVRHIAWTVFAP